MGLRLEPPAKPNRQKLERISDDHGGTKLKHGQHLIHVAISFQPKSLELQSIDPLRQPASRPTALSEFKRDHDQ